MRYLLVEDNLELAEALISRLALDGHAVDHAPSLAVGEDCLAAALYDLILRDVMLPDGDGREFLADSVEKHRVAGAESGVLKRARAPFL